MAEIRHSLNAANLALGAAWRFAGMPDGYCRKGLCERRDGLDPVAHYAVLARRYGAPRLKGPFNVEARLAAGFTQVEVDALVRPSHVTRLPAQPPDP